MSCIARKEVQSSLGSASNLTAILDEAGQALETASLIPLCLDCRKCILVGDHKQLPPNVFSKECIKLGYGRSLLERLIMNGHSYKMLDTQFRCQPKISSFVSENFYDGKLNDSASVKCHYYR